jgi:hypothetical protein
VLRRPSMLNRVLSILLVTTILACPFCCKSGCCSERAQTRGTYACQHDCCHHEGPSDRAIPPTNSNSNSKNCQCICFGAVVDHAPAPQTTIDTSFARPLPLLDAMTAAARVSCSAQALISPWPDIGANQGRAFCYLYSILLC